MPSRASIPVLSHVRLKAANGNVSISGTNLEEWLTCEMDAETENNADWLLEFAKLKGDGKVFVGVEAAGDRAVKISFDAGGHLIERIFETLPLDEWPLIPEQPKEMKPVSSKLFENIRLAYPSSAKDASRRILSGVFLEDNAVIATDGKQLVKSDCEIPMDETAIVPKTKVLNDGLLKLDGGMAVSESRSGYKMLHFASGNWLYSFKCVEGAYPNYRQVIPDAQLLKSCAEFPKEEAQALLKSLPVFEKCDMYESIALYAGGGGVKFLSTKPKSSAMLDSSAASTGKNDHAIAVFDRQYIIRAFGLGLARICFDLGHSPLIATGERGLMVWMPIRGMIPDEYYKRLGIEKPKQEKEIMTTKTETPVAPQNNAAEKPETEKTATAPVNPTGTRETFKVVHGAVNGNGANGTADPFDELQKAVTEIRNVAKTLADSMGGFQRKIVETQRAVKQREKDFRSTREILDKLKNASGF